MRRVLQGAAAIVRGVGFLAAVPVALIIQAVVAVIKILSSIFNRNKS